MTSPGPALADAEDYVRFIRDVRKEPEVAERWFRGLVHAIYSLEELPERCPVIPEQAEFSFEIRHLLYFSHRIIFRVDPTAKRVIVYRVYHGSKLGLGKGEIP
ncbi:MAG: type II toxin-antitoxin system RelE/ParE family toxin [Acidobacteria bacterium]|nr:type II toxin-antitoxin system RelE/ParE family toxin [Acidobacteriota bacterium]